MGREISGDCWNLDGRAGSHVMSCGFWKGTLLPFPFENVNSNLVAVFAVWLGMAAIRQAGGGNLDSWQNQLPSLSLSYRILLILLSWWAAQFLLRLANSLQRDVMAKTSPSALMLANCKLIICSLTPYLLTMRPLPLRAVVSSHAAHSSCHCLASCHAVDLHQLPCPSE